MTFLNSRDATLKVCPHHSLLVVSRPSCPVLIQYKLIFSVREKHSLESHHLSLSVIPAANNVGKERGAKEMSVRLDCKLIRTTKKAVSSWCLLNTATCHLKLIPSHIKRNPVSS